MPPRCLRTLLAAVFFAAAAGVPTLRGSPDGLPSAPPAAVGLSPERLRAVDKLLDDAVANKQVAGAVALIARNGRVGYLHTVGLAGPDRPMAADTIFRIASMTKPVTSVAVMMLVDADQLHVTDPVAKYLPEFHGQRVLAGDGRTVPADRDVTIHDLLTHTSGITYRFSAPKPLLEYYREADVHDGLAKTDLTLEENVERLAELPLAHQPGAAWTYGLNTDVLGRVVEVVSEQSLDDFFAEHIFKPLKMPDTAFALPPAKAERLA